MPDREKPIDQIQNFHRLFAYDAWANREALSSLKNAGTPPPRSQKIMAHIIAAEWLWFYRMEMNQAKLQALRVWPELTIDQCEKQLNDLVGIWTDYLGAAEKLKKSEQSLLLRGVSSLY